ncbi:hypothetical protein R3P38DRAFT_2533588 [Favolaschia claudopus]|uniref:Uncharacterized protein n=1 Tax=Favolaschia claudopus TaxID=2862362 RepID=A0AAW0B7V4_9AGAR
MRSTTQDTPPLLPPSSTFSTPQNHSPATHISPITPSPTPARKRAAKQRCSNAACSTSGHRHSACLYKLCKNCCVRNNQYCPAPRHMEPVAPAINSVTVTPRRPLTQSSTSTPASPSTSGSSSSSSSPLPPYARPMGRMVDVSYALKIQQGDHEIATSDRFQREVYRKSQINAISVRLWVQDDVEPIVLAASSSGHWFHPKDSPVITSLIAPLSCLTYGYWARNRWVLTDGPIEIDDPSLTVYLRLEHVSSCPSGPRSKRSRSHSDETDILDATPTPTPTLASTTVTKTSRYLPLLTQSPFSLLTFYRRPAISPLKLVTKQTVPRASAEVIRPSMPPSPSQPTFPLRYASDMDRGFKKMDAMDSHLSLTERFQTAFKTRLVRSTYHKHHTAWEQMNPDILANAIECGRSQGGEWNPLTKM